MVGTLGSLGGRLWAMTCLAPRANIGRRSQAHACGSSRTTPAVGCLGCCTAWPGGVAVAAPAGPAQAAAPAKAEAKKEEKPKEEEADVDMGGLFGDDY